MFDDPLTRIPIWIATLMYGVAVSLMLRGDFKSLTWARRCWTLGCVSFCLHVIAAFTIHYQWSHWVAVEQTATQTESQTGIRSEMGIYLNYLFSGLWIGDVIVWWRGGLAYYLKRKRAVNIGWHVFFLFMVVNGAIVFATGPARALGIIAVALIGCAGLKRMNARRES